MSLLAHLYHISKSLNGKWVFRTNTNSIRFWRKTERERTLDSKIQVKSVHSTPQHRSTTNAFRLTRMLEQLPLPHVERSVCSVEIRHCQLAAISHVANIFTWSILAALENKFWFVLFWLLRVCVFSFCCRKKRTLINAHLLMFDFAEGSFDLYTKSNRRCQDNEMKSIGGLHVDISCYPIWWAI